MEIKEKGHEFNRAVTVLEAEVKKAMVPIIEDMSTLLKDKNRSKADDMLLK